MQVHVALDDQTPDNGGLMYVPGSHRWTREGNPLPVLDFNFKDMEGIKVSHVSLHELFFRPFLEFRVARWLRHPDPHSEVSCDLKVQGQFQFSDCHFVALISVIPNLS